MMGETFIGNPISSILYPVNILFLMDNIELSIIIYLFLHIIFAAISTYFLAKSFSLSHLASFSAAIFYALSIKLLRYSTAGLLQYISPSLQFLLAVLLWGESFRLHHAIAFGCIWIAVIFYSLENWRRLRAR